MEFQRFEVRRFRTNLRRVYLVAIVIFSNPEVVHAAVGAGLILAGVLFHFWAAGYLTRGKTLVVSGPYRIVRNPFYSAAIVVDFGFGLVSRNWIAAAVFVPLITLVYLRRVRQEEQDLLEAFGDDYEAYRAYCPRRLLPKLVNLFRPAPGRTVPFTLAMILKNRELGRAGSHVAILLAAAAPLVFPAMWDWAPLWARGVGLGAFALLLAVMAVKPLESEPVEPGTGGTGHGARGTGM
jgi:protein-S-isoprenylcysteine O-methyltransferase Ste14